MTKAGSKEEASHEEASLKDRFGSKPWFKKITHSSDESGVHLNVYVDLPAMNADGVTYLKAKTGIKLCIFNVNK